MSLTIKATTRSMKEFPNATKLGNYCSGDAQACHVVNSDDVIKFTGTYEACGNYISWANCKSQRY